jgi:hypothetical protein
MIIIILVFCSIPIGLFFSMIFFADSHGWKKAVGSIAVSVLISGAITGMMMLESSNNKNLWNDGNCYNCETQWTLVNAQYVRNDGTHYFYTCESCEKLLN